ncbi:MAG TPA: hypothetical protein PLL10_04615 [Elusimicrobiales bacterium]|nr:hypothetical protein [Elusimicrobiales bacterium]
MTAPLLVFVLIAALGLVGPPIAFYLGEDSLFYAYMLRGRDFDACLQAYYSVLYSVVMLAVLYWFFLAKTAKRYALRDLILSARSNYLRQWLCAMAAAGACAVILFVQNGFAHPLLSSGGFLNARAFAEMRASAEQAMNMSVYSAGLHLFVAYALMLALFIIRKPALSAVTLAFFLFFATFSLAKSPVADVLLQLAITYLLIKQGSWRPLLYLVLGIAALIGFSAYILQAESLQPVLSGIGARLFLGQIADLPDYFTVFSSEPASAAAMLPPYIQSLFGLALLPPAKLVMNYQVAGTVNADIAGVANTFFSGSAYAYFGLFGVAIAPLIVFANFWLTGKIFSSFRKTPLNVFIAAYIVYKLSKGLFSDIGYFVFSAIQIVLLGFLAFKFAQQAAGKLNKTKHENLPHYNGSPAV